MILMRDVTPAAEDTQMPMRLLALNFPTVLPSRPDLLHRSPLGPEDNALVLRLLHFENPNGQFLIGVPASRRPPMMTGHNASDVVVVAQQGRRGAVGDGGGNAVECQVGVREACRGGGRQAVARVIAGNEGCSPTRRMKEVDGGRGRFNSSDALHIAIYIG
jgi:hypothetical protein